MFYASSSYKITLKNCTTDALNKKTGSLIVSNTADVSFINALVHIETGNCEAYFDSVGDLTVQPIKKKRRTICTCKMNNRKPMFEVLRCLTLVTVIAFLPS